ncbi:MAG: hypothetical protein K9H16_10425 [Bacteroidales bacterium]|nr:hypothetical protein [Bacteroidales bacterium]
MEKNRNILDKTLTHLRRFSPEEKIWNNLDKQLSETTINDSLSKLKTFDPPAVIWESISMELSGQEKLDQLNTFDPPEDLWVNIETKLDGRANRKSNIKTLKWLSGAAAAVMILAISYFLIVPANHQSNISYSQETIEHVNINGWVEDDNEIMLVLNQLCASNPVACASPDFKAKEKELNDLDKQKKEILNRMSAYDSNKDLQLMLTKIELEKNEIVKQMISNIM